MNGKIRRQLAILGALAALVAVLVPAGLASGSALDPPAPEGASVVLLTLGKTDEVTLVDSEGVAGTPKKITSRRNDCLSVDFAASDALLEVTADGGELGFVKDGFGVKSGGAGEPCGRVDAGEAISVSLGGDLNLYLMTAVDVDLELKFGSIVDVYYLRNGSEAAPMDTFNPSDDSDDGPDSKDGDNYRYRHRPVEDDNPLYFDTVKFVAREGAFSLEGGADLLNNDELEAYGQLDDSSRSSQFEVVEVFDGEIDCGDTVGIDEGTLGVVTLHSMDVEDVGWTTDANTCPDKPYNDEATADSVSFLPELVNVSGRYTIVITAENQPITTDGNGQITSLTMQYSPVGDLNDLQPLLACVGQPNTIMSDSGYNDFWTQTPSVGLLPSDNETACYYAVSVTPTSSGFGTEIWELFFEDDPGFSFK